MDRISSSFRSRRKRRAIASRVFLVAVGLFVWYSVATGWPGPFKRSVVNLPPRRFSPDIPVAPVVDDGLDRCAMVDATDESAKPCSDGTNIEERTAIQAPLSSPSPQPQPIEVSTAVSPTKPDDKEEEEATAEADAFTDSLRRILTLLPDELHARDLLRPIEGTGEERMRELGLRTRSFKTLFSAWEALHLVSKGEERYIRDDVIQQLRARTDLPDLLQMDLAQIIRSYEMYRSAMTRISALLFPWTAPYFADHLLMHAQLFSGGRGIVFTAGDKHAPFLLTSIPAIRALGCDLPIEVMYLGDDDLSEDFRADLEALPDVVTRDLRQMVNDAGWTLTGWAGKPFAILFSSFREAIFIDADSLFFQNPEVLFSDPSYESTGALFFKDRLMMPESKKRWLQRILPKPISKHVTQSRLWTGDSGHMQESGVVVVDKWRHFVALLLVTRMNGPERDGNSARGRIGVYDMVYGDKETFWLGWELVGDLDYAFHDGNAGVMGTLEKNTGMATVAKRPPPVILAMPSPPENSTLEEDPLPEPEPTSFTICAPQLLHLDLEGRPLWFNGWLLPNKFSGRKNQEPGQFDFYLQEPRRLQEPEAWQLHQDNICCLTTEQAFEFTKTEKGVLEMTIEAGRHAGAFGRGK